MARTGVDYVKIGLYLGPQQKACAHALAPLAGETKLVAVLFADQQPDFTLNQFNMLVAPAGDAADRVDDVQVVTVG